ncbi:acyl-CoA dehydrogenase family protein [Rhodococcus sp. NM-2]|uniref:acyl-CoA dehydrogenase family protein n=1 Tax=Rhodococcus sp. NM-2 TaxID=3401174 RepID=UPI003AB06A00
MTSVSPELTDFLAVVSKVVSSAADGESALSAMRNSLSETGLLELARDTADEPDALQWLAYTVRTVAQTDPSLAFVLASRYVADRAIDAEAATEPTFALAVPGSRPVLAGALGPDAVVVLDSTTSSLHVVSWADLAPSVDHEARTGLQRADLVSVTIPDGAAALEGSAAEAAFLWDLLTGAALAGVARRALSETQSYVLERHQFGVPIGSFAGLRALVADMDLTVAGVETALDRALEDRTSIDNLAATAGRAATSVCIDAIQAHGGYGYIDEYPLTGLLRDAIGIQARTGGRRLHVARVAERGLGPRTGRHQ